MATGRHEKDHFLVAASRLLFNDRRHAIRGRGDIVEYSSGSVSSSSMRLGSASRLTERNTSEDVSRLKQ
jgi:hypothetical protein